MPLRPSLLVTLLLLGCGGSPASSMLEVSWSFTSGDCSSNNVTTVRVTWTLDGQLQAPAEFPCSQGKGPLGPAAPNGGTYGFGADGLDAMGIVRVSHFGTTLMQSRGAPRSPVDLELRPKAANVVVTWNGCPSGVILPYFIGVYVPPATAGGMLGRKQLELQETCSRGTATLMNVPVGSWTVDLDSRALQPAIKAQKNISVTAGQDVNVSFQL